MFSAADASSGYIPASVVVSACHSLAGGFFFGSLGRRPHKRVDRHSRPSFCVLRISYSLRVSRVCTLRPLSPPSRRRFPALPALSRGWLCAHLSSVLRAALAPVTTARGENTSAAWGIANFLQRLVAKHQPEYLGWVHDSGLSFRHELYPEYKATREKLTDELQSDFDTGLARIAQILEAYGVPVLTLPGYEADDVIGTLARAGVEAGTNVVIVSGDKDFQQLVGAGVWLLNPGRGGPASVDESWVGIENGAERWASLRTSSPITWPCRDTSDNVPGVPASATRRHASSLRHTVTWSDSRACGRDHEEAPA